MSLAQALSTYFSLNLLLLIGGAGLAVFALILRRGHLRLAAQTELKLHYWVLTTIIGLSVIHPLIPRSDFFSPPAKVWSAESVKSFARDYTAPDKGGYLSFPTPLGTSTLQADHVASIWAAIAFLWLLCGGLMIARDLRNLTTIQRTSVLIRRIGKVRIFISDDIRVPFSYWLPGQANIVVPADLAERRTDYKIALAHELQHHRHGDTRWVYVMWGLKLICVFNPAIYLWSRWISEIQEFACDETLVDQRKVDSQAYARCLVEVAQTAIGRNAAPVCATGLTFLSERNLLKRRIEKMFTQSSVKIGRTVTVSVGLLLAAIMGATAFASRSLVQDRRVSLAQARAMAVKAQSESGFPVVVNDLVLKQLNRYIGTPEGRGFMRNTLARMEAFKGVVSENLREYGVPIEIMAVPIIESGYQNLTQSNAAKAVGLWQFIPSTARKFGLKVDSQIDERLDVELQTDAAVRYLQYNYLRFKDWQLSALSYNMGEEGVQKGLDTLNTRDVWALIRNGYEGDKDYLPKLMAAILIMRNPESVE